MSLFVSPWDPNKMATYIVCETNNGKKLMILFKELENQIQLNYSKPIYQDLYYIVQPFRGADIELIFEGHAVEEVFTSFDLDTGEELNGKN
jgi:hypothetical protein